MPGYFFGGNGGGAGYDDGCTPHITESGMVYLDTDYFSAIDTSEWGSQRSVSLTSGTMQACPEPDLAFDFASPETGYAAAFVQSVPGLESLTYTGGADVTDFRYSAYYCDDLGAIKLSEDLADAAVNYFEVVACPQMTELAVADALFADGWTYVSFQSCAWNQATVDAILVAAAAGGGGYGSIDLAGGTASAPSAAGTAAIATLVSRGWDIYTN